MPNRQELLMVDMILFACNLPARDNQDSLIAVILGWHIIGSYTGNRKIVKEEDVDFMEIRYRFQKNKDNVQKIKYSKYSNIELCPVRAGLRIRRRAQCLRVRAHTPITVYSSSSKGRH
eukprot:15356211-Ditylum_brightwellii.AAC.1